MGFQPMNHRQDADATKLHGQDTRATSHTPSTGDIMKSDAGDFPHIDGAREGVSSPSIGANGRGFVKKEVRHAP